MRKLSFVALAIVGLLVWPVAAHADNIAVGDQIRFNDTPVGTLGGGLFAVDVTGTGVAPDSFTFCLQVNETINVGHGSDLTSGSSYGS